jgi:hypothetical protein
VANVAPFNRVEAKTLTVPAGTASSAPLSGDVSFDPGVLVGVEIDIPDGHSGLTGLRVATAHQQLLPFTAGDWLIGNDESLEWALHSMPDTGNWQLIGYNTDVFAHTFYVRFLVSDLAGVAGASVLAPPLALS